MSKEWPKKVFIYTDGASRGNPGPCAIGLMVFNSQHQLIYEESLYLEDNNTNNFAEYQGIIKALELANRQKIHEVWIFSDSQLIVRQLQNKYKVKSTHIRPLFNRCQQLLSHIPKVNFKHIRREQNKGADALANKALDNKIKI